VVEHRVDVAGARVVDLGCGGGLVAVAAAVAGASHVVANDVDPVALGIAVRNAAANGVDVQPSQRDLLADEALAADVLLVADLFYEKEQAERSLRLLGALRRRGARVLIGDGGRPFAPASGVTVLGLERVAVNRELEGVLEREVRILELKAP
jgi:predicted nicotinamide N-methyase